MKELNMFLLRQVKENSIDLLVEPVRQSVCQFMLLEAGANKLAARSDRAQELLQQLQPYLVETIEGSERDGFKNIVYYFRFEQASLSILTSFSQLASEWSFPELFDNLSFLRESGDSALFISWMQQPIYFLTEEELDLARVKFDLTNSQVESFSSFMKHPQNKQDDIYSWITIEGYRSR